MSDRGAPKRAYDDRINRVLRLVEGLAERGHDPRVIELDGLYVELGGERRVSVEATASNAPVRPVDGGSAGPATTTADDPDSVDSYRSSVRSYRQRAHESLERRIRESQS